MGNRVEIRVSWTDSIRGLVQRWTSGQFEEVAYPSKTAACGFASYVTSNTKLV